MPHSLFGRMVLAIALVALACQLVTIAIVVALGLWPLGRLATGDLAALMVDAARDWQAAPDDAARTGLARRLAAEQGLHLLDAPPAAGASAPQPERRIALLTPKAGWDREQFEQYWLDSHGPLVATTPDYGNYRSDYAQDHVLEGGLGIEPFPFAGVASVRVPGGEISAFAETAVFRERILPDEQHFLDREACVALRVREHGKARESGKVKCMAFGNFSKGHSDGTSLAAVYNVLPDLVPRPRGILRGEVTAQPTDLGGALRLDVPQIDWVEETWFDSEQDAISHFTVRQRYQHGVPRWCFISREHVLFGNGEAQLH